MDRGRDYRERDCLMPLVASVVALADAISKRPPPGSPGLSWEGAVLLASGMQGSRESRALAT